LSLGWRRIEPLLVVKVLSCLENLTLIFCVWHLCEAGKNDKALASVKGYKEMHSDVWLE
jgi:hypothetical protein